MASYAMACASNLRTARDEGNPRGQGRDHVADTSEEDASLEEMTRKKRRLSSDQVRSLEQNFEVEKKVEPQRKVQLARDLGLHPRQVAVWFQNRRARYKTKQLQKDYDLLRFDHETLVSDFRDLKLENENLLAQLDHLKRQLQAGSAAGDGNPGTIATSSPGQTGAGPPTASGGAMGKMLGTGRHPLSRVLLLTENNNGSSTSLSAGPAMVFKEGCLTSDTESSGTLNDWNEDSPHSINDSLRSIKYSVSDVTTANGEDHQFSIAPNVYQQIYASVSDQACNSLGNVNEQCVAAVPLWEWTP